MDFFDFFFPEQAQAAHLRRIAENSVRSRAASLPNFAPVDIDELERENRELRLYLTAITQLLIEKGLILAEEVQAKVVAMLPPLPTPPPEAANPFTGLDLER